MANSNKTELAVIGAGPGGYAAAFLAADRGMGVTLIDAEKKPGGVCLHRGCIPSKALLHAAQIITQASEADYWGLQFAKPKIDLDKLRNRKQEIIDSLSGHLSEMCKKRKVNYVTAKAKFEDANTLKLDNGEQWQFEKCIIATGSRPTRLPNLDAKSERILDSTSALNLPDVPKKLLVVGGGYIGLEMATVYAALGSEVTIVELLGNLLPGVDSDLVRPLRKMMETRGAAIHVKTKVIQIKEEKNMVRVGLEGEEVAEKDQSFDRVLISVGRKPNTDELGLDNTKVELNEKGFIKVDETRRTAEKHIYAIGDAAGEPMLAHKASHEGKVAVEAMTGEPAVWEPRAIPAVVFTDPEIAWCGLTEREAKADKRKVSVARFSWAASGRAMTLGRTEGLTKLIVDPETDRVLGVGIVGYGAGEMIAEGVLAMEMGAAARDFAMTIHPHPTMTESIMEAGESLHGLATHLYRPKSKA